MLPSEPDLNAGRCCHWVLLPAGDLEDALLDEVGIGMVDIALMSAITQRPYDSVSIPILDSACAGAGRPHRWSSCRRQIGFDLPARNACKG